MKVVICSHDGQNYFGGTYEWIKNFVPALKDKGCQVNVLFYSDCSHKQSTNYQYCIALGVQCSLLPYQSFTQLTDTTEYRIQWTLEQVQRFKPDVFIANHMLPGLFAGKWIKQFGIPVIGVIHTDDSRFDWILDEFVNGAEDFSMSAVVCVSKHLTEKVKISNKYKLPVITIPCGTVQYTHEMQKVQPLKLVYAGKLVDEAKQITELARAFCRVVKEVPGTEAYIYGDGSERHKVLEILQNEGKGLPVFYKGFIPGSEIQKEISDKHVIVLLSDYEGLPLILMEAMSCGLVPVCLNIKSGIPELVIHRETGLLVEDRENDFVHKIKQLKNSEVLFESLSANAIKKINAEYSMEMVTNKWIDLFHSLRTTEISTVQLPERVVLPPVHPLLLHEDQRALSTKGFVLKQYKRMGNRLKLIFNKINTINE